MNTIKIITLLSTIFMLSACEDLAVMVTPKKQPLPSNNLLTRQAETVFWETLHNGQYVAIPVSTHLLTAAYLENPNDPVLAAHLGFLHIWLITERQRLKNIPPTIVNEIILAHKYFSDAVELNPADARYLGFYGDSQLVEGKIFHDDQQQVHGYFTIKRAIKAWPQFNYFTGGYVMSSLPANSDYFKEGLEWQWETLNLCAEESIDRNNPTFKPYMHLETQSGLQRACWNSWIAPFNFEGFFMNMGDMLVKSGDWKKAKIIYQNAKLAKNYSEWPFRHLLEKRIQSAQENVSNFQKDYISADKTIIFNSGFGCVVCHQKQ